MWDTRETTRMTGWARRGAARTHVDKIIYINTSYKTEKTHIIHLIDIRFD